ncbi:MAG: 16S rRNA (adenine(1518)-N(6)/adenine(1519)-N(6))-dimethyltransferase RsmA [Patescibacteria group bacterium]
MYGKKSLGQHFLRCEWVVDALIATADLSTDDTVLEIGPGTGVLTQALAARAGEVIAIEKDKRLADRLTYELLRKKIDNVRIITGDILRLPQTSQTRVGRFEAGLIRDDLGIGSRHYKVVANIPYYLTSRLLRMLLVTDARPERMVLTIQKEVAERIVAAPPEMNLLALSVQAYGTPRIIKAVPASCFAPRPEVDSAIISISDISDIFFRKNSVDATSFFKVARLAFGQKRKQLVNPLAAIAGGKEKAIAAIAAAGLGPHARPQELSLEQWVALSRTLTNSSRL